MLFEYKNRIDDEWEEKLKKVNRFYELIETTPRRVPIVNGLNVTLNKGRKKMYSYSQNNFFCDKFRIVVHIRTSYSDDKEICDIYAQKLK